MQRPATCSNENINCDHWAWTGKCEKDPGYMLSYCKKACNICSLEVEYVGSPCTDYFAGRQCNECTGDCNDDSDCAGRLRCAFRSFSSGIENVPGCSWSGTERYAGTDVCFLPITRPGTINYVGECGEGKYLCGLCEGDCDDDLDCEAGLICSQRDGYEPVEGCAGEGGQRDMFARDVCVPGPPTVKYVGSPCTDYFSSGKCNECTGDCNNDSDCYGNLRCAHRFDSIGGQEDVPGCAWSGEERFVGFVSICFNVVLLSKIYSLYLFQPLPKRLSAHYSARHNQLRWRVWR